jgi:peptidoglycan/xylan/chitin deacetylase (PgdA/CDA1 family)
MSASLSKKRWIGKIFNRFVRHGSDRSVILIYHSVGGGCVSTRVEHFREQMAWLADHAEVVHLETLLQQETYQTQPGAKRKLRIALTFDDGYRTVHDVAAPILMQYGFPATVYVNSAHIGEHEHQPSNSSLGHYPDESFMIWREVIDLHSWGWTIGSHGVEHLDLTRQSPQVVSVQLSESKRVIARAVGQECRHFSYTWGHYNPIVRSAVAAEGYLSAVAGLHGALTSNSDILALPRLDIRADYELSDFIDVVTGCWDFLGLKQRMLQLLP